MMRRSMWCISEPHPRLPTEAGRHAARALAQMLVPEPYSVLTRGDVGEAEAAVAARDGGVGVGGHDDVSAHPGVEHVAIDDDAARLHKAVGLLGPMRQAQIEDGSEAVPAGVDVVQNGVAVAQPERLSDRHDLYAGDEGTRYVVEYRGRRLARFARVDAVEPDRDVAEAALRPDEQPFVRGALSTETAILPNRHPRRGRRRAVVDDATGDTPAVLDSDFPVGARGQCEEQRQPDNKVPTQAETFPKGITYQMIPRPFRQAQQAGPRACDASSLSKGRGILTGVHGMYAREGSRIILYVIPFLTARRTFGTSHSSRPCSIHASPRPTASRLPLNLVTP